MPVASLAVQVEVPAGETREVTFLLAWHFPNRQTWTPATGQQAADCCEDGACTPGTSNRIGNYYTTRFEDAWDAAVQTAASLEQLEADTLQFVRSLCDSDLPSAVNEAALLISARCERKPAFGRRMVFSLAGKDVTIQPDAVMARVPMSGTMSRRRLFCSAILLAYARGRVSACHATTMA